MAIHDNPDEFRRFMVQACAEKAVVFAKRLGQMVELNSDQQVLDTLLHDYRSLRNEYADFHDIAPPGLLKNYKVAAIFIFLLSSREAEPIFRFPTGTRESVKREVMVSFMMNLVFSLLLLSPPRDTGENDLIEDLEYCLLREVPQNLEYLSFSFHAMCRLMGQPSEFESV